MEKRGSRGGVEVEEVSKERRKKTTNGACLSLDSLLFFLLLDARPPRGTKPLAKRNQSITSSLLFRMTAVPSQVAVALGAIAFSAFFLWFVK
jgi:hypothetical protein